MAEILYRIPLVAEPQSFDMSIGELSLTISVVWNEELPAWEMTALNTLTSEFLFNALPLVTGVDLMEQFKHLGIEGKVFVYTNGDADAVPTLTNLGVESHMYYLVGEEDAG